MNNQIPLLLAFAKEHKLELTKEFMEKIQEFCNLLLEANKQTNLVSKNDSQKLLTRHVADSLIFAAYIRMDGCTGVTCNAPTLPHTPTWLDIGAGAGFPVIPLCLYFKHIKFFAIENRKKRCEFLYTVKQKLDLQNLAIIQCKAESSDLRNMDFVSCRAVGSLEDDFELAKKLLKKGGYFLTLKSKRIINEMKLKNDKLLEQIDVFNYKLPKEEMEYSLAAIMK